MKKLFAAILSSLGLLPLASNAADFQPLFNGTNLTGWAEVNKVSFTATNGNLALISGMGWLRTESEYADFILELEYRPLVADYDSGVFVRCGLEGKPWPKDGWQVNLRYNALGALVRGYKTVLPAESPKLPVGQWVKVRIECRGKKITLTLNGEKQWESDALDRDRGYIGFQAEEKAFEFRSISLRELEPALPGNQK
jgi:hypothetical protein